MSISRHDVVIVSFYRNGSKSREDGLYGVLSVEVVVDTSWGDFECSGDCCL